MSTIPIAAASTWTQSARARVRDVQDSLLAAAEWARESGADAATTDLLVQPYRELLDNLYERDMPLAKLADQSDLLLHVHGTAASGPTPRVSVVTRVLTQTRDEVTRLAKQLGGVKSVRVPAALDMGLVGIANGSLFVGFSAVDATDAADLTRRAVDTICEVSGLVAGDATLLDLAKAFPDPAARDMAVAAVRHLSPSGLAGISAIDVLGRRVARTIALTTETRRHARGLMAQPAESTSKKVTYVGTIRELDLDASRFEVRNIDGHPDDVRCAHEIDEQEIKQYVDRRVRVTGTPEYGPQKTVRLLWVDEVELLE
jgi:hypothetical protein